MYLACQSHKVIVSNVFFSEHHWISHETESASKEITTKAQIAATVR